jgi:hypothetical protein
VNLFSCTSILSNVLSIALNKTFKGRLSYLYAHNLSSFDGIFALRHLWELGTVEPLIHNGKVISIKFRLCNGKTFLFKDSMLLLPIALRNLCLAFGVLTPKGYFPFKLMNIFYTGVYPSYSYWTGFTVEQWSELKIPFLKRMWSFKDESIKYCTQDCVALHQVLTKFNELVYGKFQVNIHSVLTLPALAMRIYKTHYMSENSIFQLSGLVEQAIRQSYIGGHVDVYIPHNIIGGFFSKTFRKLYYYDVNSLYPAVMGNFPMPVGLPTYFEGNIRAIDSNAFGVFYCKITSPEFINHPLLLRRIKTSNGIRIYSWIGILDWLDHFN